MTATASSTQATPAESAPYSLRVYNTLSKVKEPLEPLVPGQIRMYLCGPTVYAPSHIGHMVGPVIFDSIKRYLTYCGLKVTWVVNITDVDDKLINKANEKNCTMADLAREMTADYMTNLQAMGVDTIDHFPRATEHMGGIIQFTQELIDRGYAYVSDGDVLFDVAKDREYGKLTNRSLESLAGDGGGAAEKKRSAADFALWKAAKPGEPSWPSPWGNGRPGWHIECSAMSRALLGPSFDIHGGGLDLMFPHHENEIAQSECCHGAPMAKYWMHNGLLQRSDETGKLGGRATRAATEGDLASQEANKLSKSKGAGAFSELLKQYPAEVIRFFLLSTQYRRPIEYSDDQLQEKRKGVETFYRYFARFERVTGKSFYALPAATRRSEGDHLAAAPVAGLGRDFRTRFLEAMDDDFNTGGGMGVLFEMLSALNRFIDQEKLENPGEKNAEKLAQLIAATTILRELALTTGLFRLPPPAEAGGDDALVGQLMSLLIQLRAEARKSKNFALADQIRKSLAEMNVLLEDRPDGTGWSVQK